MTVGEGEYELLNSTEDTNLTETVITMLDEIKKTRALANQRPHFMSFLDEAQITNFKLMEPEVQNNIIIALENAEYFSTADVLALIGEQMNKTNMSYEDNLIQNIPTPLKEAWNALPQENKLSFIAESKYFPLTSKTDIKSFWNTRSFAKVAIGTKDPKYLCPPYKIIILDEADAMTKEAQAALRKVMEENSNITRFCFICNYINQIIEPINSRCVKIRFKPINKKYIVNKLEWISNKEKIIINRDALQSIAEISNGDFRKSILMLQNVKYINIDRGLDSQITQTDIYQMCKYISDTELLEYIEKIKNNNNVINIILITKDIINKGFIFNSVIIKIIEYITYSKSIKDSNKAKILFEMSFIEKNINDGADEYIQLLKLFNNISNI
jgi:DNA polymerase III delta prime subunit